MGRSDCSCCLFSQYALMLSFVSGGIGSGDVSSHLIEESRLSVSTRHIDSYESSRSTVSSSKYGIYSSKDKCKT